MTISEYHKLHIFFFSREREEAPKFEKCKKGETQTLVCAGQTIALSNWTIF